MSGLLSLLRRHSPVSKNFQNGSFWLRQTSLPKYSSHSYAHSKCRAMTIYSGHSEKQIRGRHSNLTSNFPISSRTKFTFDSSVSTITQRFYSDNYSGSGTQLKDDDLEEQFVRGSGAGGQKINKTANCVILKHKESGIVIKCQETRSLQKNRQIAREILLERLEEERKQSQHNKAKGISKLRAQNAKRTRKIIKKHFKSRRDRTMMD